MFKNLTIVARIGLGFGVLFALLMGISAFTFLSVENSKESFNQYRDLARDSVLAGRLQANMLMARFYTKRFLKSGSEEDIREYNKRRKLMEQFLDEGTLMILKPERAKKIALIQELVDDYIDAFDKVVSYKGQRDDIIYKGLDPNGFAMRKAMTDIIESAYKDEDITAAYFAGRIQEHLLLARLYATKYLDTNNEADVKRFNDELVVKIELLIETMHLELQNPARQALFNEFLEKREIYRKNFAQLVKIITNRNDVINNRMDKIGPVIANAAETIKLSVKKDQDTLGPLVKEANEQTIFRVIYICLASLTTAILLSVLITRAVRKPIGILVNSVEEFGKGNMDIRIDIVAKNEVGILAKAFNIMAEKVKVISDQQSKLHWLSSARVEFDEKIRGIRETDKLADMTLDYLANVMHAQVGSIYLVNADDSNRLSFLAGYACKKEETQDKVFEFGEGLVGQAAKKGELMFFNNIPEGYIAPSIMSSMGESKPSNIIALPIMHQNRALCVIELATAYAFSEIQIDLLNQLGNGIGVAFNSSIANMQLNELLERSEELREKLMSQQEELRAANEELQESEMRLKSQQEELQTANGELESKTKNLQAQQKEIERKNIEIEEKAVDLESSNRYKSEFLANMSHELRTPLNSILLLSKFLSDDKELTKEHIEMAQTISLSGKDLLNLIDDILDLSKIEAGKVELSISEINLKELADNVKRNFKHLVNDKNLELSVLVASEAPEYIYSDMQRLNQVIKNFISNSLKFTEQGSINFSIGRPDSNIKLAESAIDVNHAIAITISDTGIGIPEDCQKIIFEAFQQADGTTSRQYGGTGLGLSIAAELSRLMGGEIQLQSEKGRGSSFTLYLPEKFGADMAAENTTGKNSGPRSEIIEPAPRKIKYAEKESLPAKQTITAEKESLPAKQTINDDRDDISHGDKSLLIIEDDIRFSGILMKLGRKKGFKCITAVDGEIGLNLAFKHMPSAVILDYVLPGLNGLVVLNKLKEDPKTRHIPVQMFSVEDNKLVAGKLGAIGFYTKPVLPEDIEKSFKHIEYIISEKLKRLLVVEDDKTTRYAIAGLLGNGDIAISTASTGNEALKCLKSDHFDCVVLDLKLPDMTGFDLLEKIKNDISLAGLPIIVYTGKELSKEEEADLAKYTESIIVKGAKSPERLLDETSLFLHRVESNLPKEKQEMIRMTHDKGLVFKDKKVLIVDDDMRNVFALKKIMADKGMATIVGVNGEECLGHLDNDPEIDLVLMDIMMPVMDGYEAMQRIRNQQKFKNLPIIALTAKAMAEDRTKCIQYGANDYIAKPIDIDKLMSLLHVWLYNE